MKFEFLRKFHDLRTVFPAFFISVFLTFLLFSCTQPTRPDNETLQAMGLSPIATDTRIPDIEYVSIDGSTTRLSDLKGSVVMLNFWASWCPPCRAEIPSMSRLNAELKGNDFAILAVNVGEQTALVESFVKEFDMDFPVYLDPEAEAAMEFGVPSLPTTILFDRSGEAVALVRGSIEWDSEIVIREMQDWTR